MTVSTAAADDAELARRIAEEAGALLLRVRADGASLEAKLLRDRGDAAAQELLAGALAAARPDDAVLSEEAADDPRRLAADRVWIVDPLDGTREFAEPGRDDWAVHVALWERGTLRVGVVALPAQGRTLTSAAPPRVPAPHDGPIRLAVSRTRPPALIAGLTRLLDVELVPMGSAGAKVSAVVLGAVDAYVHAGGQYEWDSAAPVAVAQAAGLHASRVDGSPLAYNSANPLLPDLLVCRPDLSAALLQAVSRCNEEGAA